MSTLDDITKEKQRVGEALARVDVQREKLASQLGELEATERVLARYSKGAPARRTGSAKTPDRGQGDRSSPVASSTAQHGRKTSCSRERPRRASAIKFLPWQTARRSRKSPLHATGFAPTMSASPSPGTNEPAASKSATGSSMRRNRRSKPNPLRPNTGTKTASVLFRRYGIPRWRPSNAPCSGTDRRARAMSARSWAYRGTSSVDISHAA